jgi:hypothetical protein
MHALFKPCSQAGLLAGFSMNAAGSGGRRPGIGCLHFQTKQRKAGVQLNMQQWMEMMYELTYILHE